VCAEYNSDKLALFENCLRRCWRTYIEIYYLTAALNMIIRKAEITDKERWDAFIESQGGDLNYYFDWKYVIEAGGNDCIQLILERDHSQILGIFSVIKKHKRFYSALVSWAGSGGPLIKRDLSKEERYLARKMFLQHLDVHYSKACSNSILAEFQIPGAESDAEIARSLRDCGYRLRHDNTTGLPCSFVIELKPPFEKNIWMGLWSQKFRQALRKVEKNGITVIVDKEMRYAETFVGMLIANYERHGNYVPPQRNEIITELEVFKNQTKLFVAMDKNTPVVILSCHYTPSTCYLWQVGSYTKGTDDINKYTYKAAIEDACNSGYRFVDLGITSEPGLVKMKERFGGTRIPLRVCEKRYSVPRSIMELAPRLIANVLHNKNYLWYHRRKIWDWVFHW
jgi:hypothetical protein